MLLSKETKLTMTVEALLKLMYEEWHCGNYNSPSYGIVTNFLKENEGDENFSEGNARSFLEDLKKSGVQIEGVKTTSDK